MLQKYNIKIKTLVNITSHNKLTFNQYLHNELHVIDGFKYTSTYPARRGSMINKTD